MSIAIVAVEPGDDRHHAQLLDALTAAKREAKLRKRERRSRDMALSEARFS